MTELGSSWITSAGWRLGGRRALGWGHGKIKQASPGPRLTRDQSYHQMSALDFKRTPEGLTDQFAEEVAPSGTCKEVSKMPPAGGTEARLWTARPACADR